MDLVSLCLENDLKTIKMTNWKTSARNRTAYNGILRKTRAIQGNRDSEEKLLNSWYLKFFKNSRVKSSSFKKSKRIYWKSRSRGEERNKHTLLFNMTRKFSKELILQYEYIVFLWLFQKCIIYLSISWLYIFWGKNFPRNTFRLFWYYV